MNQDDQELGMGPERSPDDRSFDELVARARAGDQDASGELIENYRNYLLFLANADVDQDLRTKFAASDAVQESMLHAQLKLDQFAGETEAEWKAWLRTILTNDILKSRRQFNAQKRNANREVNIQDHSAVGRRLLDDHLTPCSEAIQQEKQLAMKLAMSQLTADQQLVIQLRNFEQLGFDEIGERMNRSADAARKMWARTIEALKLALATTDACSSDGHSDRE